MKEESNPQSLFNTFATVLSKTPIFISIIISAISIAYLVGFFQAKAYYSTFGMDDLVADLSNNELLFFSWIPLTMLAFFIWLGVLDLVETENTKREPSRWKISLYVVKYGWLVLILLNVAGYFLEKSGCLKISSIITSVTAIGYAFLAGAAFEGLIIAVHKNRQTFNITVASYIVALLLFGLYQVPVSMGQDRAKRDLNPDSTSLLEIKMKENAEPLHLLRISGDRVFVVRLEHRESDYKPQINIHGIEEVEFFQKADK